MIVKDVEEAEENNQLAYHDYTKQGIFGQYTKYGYTSHETTIDESSIDTDNTVNTDKETETYNLIDRGTRGVPTINNKDIAIKLPNEIKALLG